MSLYRISTWDGEEFEEGKYRKFLKEISQDVLSESGILRQGRDDFFPFPRGDVTLSKIRETGDSRIVSVECQTRRESDHEDLLTYATICGEFRCREIKNGN